MPYIALRIAEFVPPPATNTTPASISEAAGTATATPGVWVNAGTITGQWYVNGILEVGETGLTFDVTGLSDGDTYYYRETTLGVSQDSNTLTYSVPIDNSTYQLQVDPAAFDQDLVDFPARIDLSFAPTEWWAEIARTDGGDIRVFDVNDTAISFALYDIDTTAETGWLIATQTITTAIATVYKMVANNDPAMLPIADNAPGGKEDAWAAFDAVYLFRSGLTDETGNARTLVPSGTTPTFVTDVYGLGGGVSNEAATGFLSYANDPAFDDQNFEMFGIGACLVDSGGNQMMMSTVNSTSSNSTRRLIGIRDDGRNYTYFTDAGASSWHEGRGVVQDETVSLSFSGRDGVSARVDGFFYVDGAYADGVDAEQRSADTLQVLSGRGTSSSTDWRGTCNIALFGLTDYRGDDWHRALHENFRQTQGIFQPGAVINPVVGLQ